jgi:hypothetical protein
MHSGQPALLYLVPSTLGKTEQQQSDAVFDISVQNTSEF